MLPYWVWLSERKHVTEAVRMQLLAHFEDPEQIWRAKAEDFSWMDELTVNALEDLLDKSLGSARRTVEFCAAKGIGILTVDDGRYPARLRAIADPPTVLYYLGTLPEFDSIPAIGIVGTRRASSYGMTAARQMGWQIARWGGLVVSGMADGIDTEATLGALDAGCAAVAVLGCGPERAYPKSNQGLHGELCRRGCVLSEYAPGTPPYKWNFPRRNRIISGLSCGVLVVEAPEKSGALITAREALDQGRDVFVVPGNIDSPTCRGSNTLLRDGAIAVLTGEQVMEEYAARFPDAVQPPREEAEHPQPSWFAEKPQPDVPAAETADDKKDIDKAQPPSYIDLESIADTLSPTELAIMESICAGERLIDNVIAETGLSAGEVLAAMTILEIRGLVMTLPGHRVEPGSK